MSTQLDPLKTTSQELHLKYRHLVVSGCSFSAGSSSIDLAKSDPSVWPHWLLKKIHFDRFANLSIVGGGNLSASYNLLFYLENRFCDPADTLVIFNLTEFFRIDLICPVDHPDSTRWFSWDKDFGFSWIIEPLFEDKKSPFHGKLQKNMGFEQTIMLNSLHVLALFSYLENRGYRYYFMLMSQECLDHAAPFLQEKIKQNQNRFINFPGHECMKEYVSDLGLTSSKFDHHPSTIGHKVIADSVFERLRNECQ